MIKDIMKFIAILIVVLVTNIVFYRAPLPVTVLSLLVVPVCIVLLCNFIIKRFYNKNE